MITMISMTKAKAGLSRDEFIHYYDTFHVPLAFRLHPEIVGHTRNYVPPEMFGKGDFDVVSEITFASAEALEAVSLRSADPKITEEVVQDEEKFINRESVRIFIAEQHRLTR